MCVRESLRRTPLQTDGRLATQRMGTLSFSPAWPLPAEKNGPARRPKADPRLLTKSCATERRASRPQGAKLHAKRVATCGQFRESCRAPTTFDVATRQINPAVDD